MGHKKKDSDLLERIAALEAELLQLRKEVARLEEEKARLEAENAELRRRLAKDSHNSHKPPSSDGYRKKPRRTSAMPKGPRRKRGGQVGHQGRTLRQVSQPDKVQVHLPRHCAVCRREIQENETYRVVGLRQVFDLPEPKLEVTEHQLGEITCCGVSQRGVYPETVKAGVQYGSGVRAFVLGLYRCGEVLEGEAAEEARQRYRAILSQAEAEEPLPKKRKGQRGRAKNSPGRNLMLSLQKYEDSVLAFAFVSCIYMLAWQNGI